MKIVSILICLALVGCSVPGSQASQIPSSTAPVKRSSPTMPVATANPTSFKQSTSTPNPTDVLPSTPTEQVVPTDAGIPLSLLRKNQLVYQPVYQITTSSIPGWNQVTNLEYGFSFRYPANLQLSTSGNFVWVSLENANLFFGFRKPDDPVGFNYIKNEYISYLPGSHGNPDLLGEVTVRSALEIKGLPISKSAVRITDRDWFVLYNNGEEFEVKKMVGGAQVGRLLLSGIVESTISPNAPPEGYQGITPAVQDLADQIIATFDFQTYSFSGWKAYSDPDFGLSFEYPTEWQTTTRIGQAQPYGSPNAIVKREEFSGPGGIIILDTWDAHNLKMADWQNWWHEWTSAPHEGYEPKEPNAQVFQMPALLFVAPMEQEYDELSLFFTDGKYIYRLMYLMQDRRIGLEVFFRMVNTLKSQTKGAANPLLPASDID